LTLGCLKSTLYHISEVPFWIYKLKFDRLRIAQLPQLKKVRFMKLYKYLTLIVLLGMASAAYATPIDPTIILRGGGLSIPIEGTVFGGVFPNPDSSNCGEDPNCIAYHNANDFTFTGIHLTFSDSFDLAYSCDNSQDPFFTNCSVSDNVVTFSGLTNNFFSAFSVLDSSNTCDGSCQGIGGGTPFILAISGLPTGATTSFTGLADTAVTNTPEPASALLFVIAMGAIALFLKRRSKLIAA
jgi:hypothetical protein